MKKTIWILFTVFVCIGAPVKSASTNDRFADVKITTQQVSDKIYALFGAGGNIGVSKGKDGLLMIDDQFGPLAPKIKAALKELGDDSPTYLLNTHYHGDHTGGNDAFAPESLILAHENVRVRLLAGDQSKRFGDPALPVITYEKIAHIYFNGEEIQLIHLPKGHTDGDSIVYFTGSNVIHMGDHFFKDRFPYVDLDAGGTVNGLTANIETVLTMVNDDTRLIPGHGSLATKKDLQNYLEMLKATSSLVNNAIESGDSLDEIKARGLGSQWQNWGIGFINEERWLQTLYGSLKSETQ